MVGDDTDDRQIAQNMSCSPSPGRDHLFVENTLIGIDQKLRICSIGLNNIHTCQKEQTAPTKLSLKSHLSFLQTVGSYGTLAQERVKD